MQQKAACFLHSSVLNKWAKFGAKLSSYFWDIVIFFLERFILAYSVYAVELLVMSENVWVLKSCKMQTCYLLYKLYKTTNLEDMLCAKCAHRWHYCVNKSDILMEIYRRKVSNYKVCITINPLVFKLFFAALFNKKFELMLTWHTKAYSSFYSQTVSLSPAISSQFILRVCAAAENRKNQ